VKQVGKLAKLKYLTIVRPTDRMAMPYATTLYAASLGILQKNNI